MKFIRATFLTEHLWRLLLYLTGYAIVELVDQILESFEDNKYNVSGVFINLSTKTFDTVDPSILLNKLELYCMRKIQNNYM